MSAVYLYCMACAAWATFGHRASEKHQQRMTWKPEWYSCKRVPADALKETPDASGNTDPMLPPGLPDATMQPSASAGTTSSSSSMTFSFAGLVDDHIALKQEVAELRNQIRQIKEMLKDTVM